LTSTSLLASGGLRFVVRGLRGEVEGQVEAEGQDRWRFEAKKVGGLWLEA